MATKVLPAYLSAALARTNNLDCPLAVGAKWREAIRRFEDGDLVVDTKEVVNLFISDTKDLAEHAAACSRGCVYL